MKLPAEWSKQSGVQLTWPDDTTPWYELDKVQECYVDIISAILKFEPVLLVTADVDAAKDRISEIFSAKGLDAALMDQIRMVACPINDTWARDHGGISVLGEEGEKYIYDFVFNGWGQKFASDLDNYITQNIFFDNVFEEDVMCVDMRPFVLEGGSIDTDGEGTLLTTTECLMSKNRNEYLEQEDIEGELKKAFGLDRILWLDDGGIAGDDTDSHVDILARFCSKDTIAYSQCVDPDDENYAALRKMEDQLRTFKTKEGKAYRLIPLPIPPAMYLDGYRLPASYANFLIVNGGVIVPASGAETDEFAKSQLQSAFPDKEIIMVDCRPLLSGHGSLHCVTMQYPEGYIR